MGSKFDDQSSLDKSSVSENLTLDLTESIITESLNESKSEEMKRVSEQSIED
jgi:hypothetical protein